MKKNNRIKQIIIISAICLLLITAAIVVCLIFFQKGDIEANIDSPETAVKNFEKSFNSYDIDTMLDCIHPTYRKALSAGADLLALINSKKKSKWNISYILKLAKIGIPMLPYIPELDIKSDDLPHLSLNVTEYEIDGDTADCKVSGNISAGEHSKDFEYDVILEKVDDVWYIVKTK